MGTNIIQHHFVICTIKYTHLCIRHRVQTSIALKAFIFVITQWLTASLLTRPTWASNIVYYIQYKVLIIFLSHP
jgi:hypothetical protein